MAAYLAASEHRVYLCNIRWDVEKHTLRSLCEAQGIATGLANIGLCRKDEFGATCVFSVACMFEG